MLVDAAVLPLDPLVGTPYQARVSIGSGYTSEVYEAKGPGGETLAIKVLPIAFRDSQEAKGRLLQEGRILASVRHPNLVPLRDIGMTRDGRPFLAMPRLQGATLRHFLDKHGPLSPSLAIDLVVDGLLGLHAAHRYGVVHRDVKPSNIFVEQSRGSARRATMIDFGIAKVHGVFAHQTTANHLLGTPKYAAPEQILGGRVDARTDVYAMGIVLFECIACRWPFEVLAGASVQEIMRAHVAFTPRRLDEVSPASNALANVVAQALEKRPSRRFPSALAFAMALRAVQTFPRPPSSPTARNARTAPAARAALEGSVA